MTRSIIFCVLLMAKNAIAQQTPSVIPPSPTAASLVKYADVPVGLYTGVPSISIPLYELKGTHLTLPITLSYHAGGIRVEENSSWVGLGWSLNAGGVITRTPKGIRDEALHGFLYEGNQTIPQHPPVYGYFDQVLAAAKDTEPDIFFYNFNGNSGKFYLRPISSTQAVGHSIPHKDLKIVCTYQSDLITSFSIWTEDGTEYVFDQIETTTTRAYTFDVRSPIGDPVSIGDNTNISVTGWYLQKIKSANGGEEITFNYVPEHAQYKTTKKGRVTYEAAGPLVSRTMTYSDIVTAGLRLTSIRFEKIGVTVEFTAGKVREDFLHTTTAPPMALEWVTISHDDLQTPIKKFELTTSYFTNHLADFTVTAQGVPANEKYLYKRLRLDEVREWSGDQTESNPPYVFTYNNSLVPPKNAETQDHWGFYNGAVEPFYYDQYYSKYYMTSAFNGEVDDDHDTFSFACNNSSQILVNIPTEKMALLKIDGVNREPNPNSMQVGILTAVQYPTGGKTTLEYSPHEYGYVANEQITKEVFAMESPLAFVDRPWDNNPTADETHEYEFSVPKTTLYRINFSIEFAYKDAIDYENGIAYNRNEVILQGSQQGVDLPHPHVRINWDNTGNGTGNIYASLWNEPDGVWGGSFPVTNLAGTSVESSVIVTQEDGNGNDYARRRATGFVVVRLFPGTTYKLIAKRKYDASTNCFGPGTCYVNNNEAWIGVDTQVETEELLYTQKSFLAGGLRIIRKTEAPGFGGTPIVTEYDYAETEENHINTDRSSGCLLALPNHTNTEIMQSEEFQPAMPGATPGVTLAEFFFYALPGPLNLFFLGSIKREMALGCMSVTLNTYTIFTIDADYSLPLSTTQGSHISYRQVRVRQLGNGSTITKFLSGYDHPDTYPTAVYSVINAPTEEGQGYFTTHSLNPEYPTAYRNVIPVNNNDWKRGFEADKIILNEDGQVKSTEHYDYTFQIKETIDALLVFWHRVIPNSQTLSRIAYHQYQLASGWVFMNHKTVKSMENDNELIANFDYEHNSYNHIAVTRQVQSTSGDGTLETTFLYSADKPSIPNTPSTVFDGMASRNILYAQVKTEQFRSSNPIGGKITNYKEDNGNFVPASEEILEGNSYTTRLTYDSYDTRGNLLQFSKSNDAPTSFIWDYDDSLPVAASNNALSTSIAYASFESNGTGNFNYSGPKANSFSAKAGRFYHDFSSGSPITKNLAAGTYTLTFWAKGVVSVTGPTAVETSASQPDGEGWILNTKKLNATVPVLLTISGSGSVVDEVRLCPSSAQITTYTFDPQIGMTTQNDANNIVTQYKFDKLGRLHYILDHKGNIVKKYTYHYVGQ